MRGGSKFILIALITLLLFITTFVQAGYNEAESIDVELITSSGDSAIVSVVYTSYAPGMCPDTCGCVLYPSGLCCVNYLFYINESGAYFMDLSWDPPETYEYHNHLYVFTTAFNDTVEIFKMGPDCFEKILSVAPEVKHYNVYFAVSMPYTAFKVGPSKVVIYRLEPEVKLVKTVNLTKIDSFSFKGIKIKKQRDSVILQGKNQTITHVILSGENQTVTTPKLPTEVENDKLTFTFKGETVKIPADELSEHLWIKGEVNTLKVYPLKDSVLILPPDVLHYFSPCGNDTGELLYIDKKRVKIESLSKPLAVFFYNVQKERLKVFSLGTPTETLFQVSTEKVGFRECKENFEGRKEGSDTTILLPIAVTIIVFIPYILYMFFKKRH